GCSQLGSAQLRISSSVIDSASGERWRAQNSHSIIWAIWMRPSSLISCGTRPPRCSTSQYFAHATATSGFWPMVAYQAMGGLLVTAAWSRMSRSPWSPTASGSILGIRGTCVAMFVLMGGTVRAGSLYRQRPRAMRAMPWRHGGAAVRGYGRGTARPPHVSADHRLGHDHRGLGRAAPRPVRSLARQ